MMPELTPAMRGAFSPILSLSMAKIRIIIHSAKSFARKNCEPEEA